MVGGAATQTSARLRSCLIGQSITCLFALSPVITAALPVLLAARCTLPVPAACGLNRLALFEQVKLRANNPLSLPPSPTFNCMLLRPLAVLLRAARPLHQQQARIVATPHIRLYASAPTPKKERIPFPTMAAVSDQDVIARFGALNISAPKVIEHAAVKGGAEWRAELDKLGKTGVAITKTVRGLPRPTARRGAFIDTTHSSSSSPRRPRRPSPPPSSLSPRRTLRPRRASSATSSSSRSFVWPTRT